MHFEGKKRIFVGEENASSYTADTILTHPALRNSGLKGRTLLVLCCLLHHYDQGQQICILFLLYSGSCFMSSMTDLSWATSDKTCSRAGMDPLSSLRVCYCLC